jgi:hypothetical protein
VRCRIVEGVTLEAVDALTQLSLAGIPVWPGAAFLALLRIGKTFERAVSRLPSWCNEWIDVARNLREYRARR